MENMGYSKYFYIFWALHLGNSLNHYYINMSLDSDTICSAAGYVRKIELHKTRHQALNVYVNQSKKHTNDWIANHHCTFKVSANHDCGVMAVIQNLDLRRDENGNCLDYVEFESEDKPRKYCGKWSVIAFEYPHISENEMDYSYYTQQHKIKTTIHIDKKRLLPSEESEINIVYTLFKKSCTKYNFQCVPGMNNYCIDEMLKNDGFVNCAFNGGLDETKNRTLININQKDEPRIELGVMAAVIIMVFVVFCVSLYVIKKTRCLCWAPRFALTPGARHEAGSTTETTSEPQGEVPQSIPAPSAPPEDAPPSYTSLFPEAK